MQLSTLNTYAEASSERVDDLCCPINYDPELLKAIPEEVIQKDYGCGDPSKYIHQGETVLDLGSGTGKICFISSQVVGSKGKIIGVDMGDQMLEVARRNEPIVSHNIGYSNTTFLKGSIDDLKVDLEKVDEYLSINPITNSKDLWAFNEYLEKLRSDPLIADNSIDVIVSNCVLNLVDQDKKENLFKEMFRVLREGGRCVISDIVCDEVVPQHLRANSQLWAGCISGSYEEKAFLDAFEKVGFVGVEILKYDSNPWKVVEGYEFRSVTVRAFKPSSDLCYEGRQAVIYRGPFKSVKDDGGHEFERGCRSAVCLKTYSLLQNEGYEQHFIFIEPHNVNHLSTELFDCSRKYRDPRESKGAKVEYKQQAGSCESDKCC
jgi:ubiquinone/menaquinone biosynthesis C-methylase UbiE